MHTLTSPPSTKFRDAQGRSWDLALTIGKARRVKDAAAVDIGLVSDGKIFLELGVDPFKLAVVLYTLCEEQAEAQRVTPEQFAESLDGDAIDGAMEALIEAIVLFTRAPMRGAMRTVIQTTMAAQAKSMEAVEAWATANGDRLAETVLTKATEALSTLGAA